MTSALELFWLAALTAIVFGLLRYSHKPYDFTALVERIEALEREKASWVCGACGQPWTGQKCGQADNEWPFATCWPFQASPPPKFPPPGEGKIVNFKGENGRLYAAGYKGR